MQWLLEKGLFGVSRGYWIFFVAVVLVVLWLVIVQGERKEARENQKIGATIEREENLRETIERTKEGKQAREDIQSVGAGGDNLRFQQCLRSARTPENCRRFLPEREPDNR